jgi:hypothetical protein
LPAFILSKIKIMNDKNSYAQIIEALEKVYGKAGRNGFGSAVFYDASKQDLSLASIALENYKIFIGEKWNAESEAAWMSAWKLVYERNPGMAADILTELYNIKDPDAKRSVPLLTELIENAEQGKLALAAAYNHPDISQVQVFKVGDNAEMSGLLLSGLFSDHSACSIICLMD